MPGVDINQLQMTRRTLPAGNVDGSQIGPARGGRYNEDYFLNVVPTLHVLADEGSYFVATNQTPGTGISPNAVETSFSDTRGFFVIANTESPANALAKRIYLHRLRLMLLATAPTATVSL